MTLIYPSDFLIRRWFLLLWKKSCLTSIWSTLRHRLGTLMVFASNLPIFSFFLMSSLSRLEQLWMFSSILSWSCRLKDSYKRFCLPYSTSEGDILVEELVWQLKLSWDISSRVFGLGCWRGGIHLIELLFGWSNWIGFALLVVGRRSWIWRLVWCASFYWQERNLQLHGGISLDVQVVTGLGQLVVRDRCLACSSDNSFSRISSSLWDWFSWVVSCAFLCGSLFGFLIRFVGFILLCLDLGC